MGTWWRAPGAALTALLAGTLVLTVGVVPSGASSTVPGSMLRSYVAQVESVRLPVNKLLNGADPILDAYQDKQISPQTASARMNALEMRFASYMVDVDAIDPPDAALRRVNAPYAHTFLLEDTYLSALASDLVDGDFDGLPDTQNAQRRAIIEWRTQLELLARSAGVRLPADLQQAGRGEIAPSPSGS